MTPEERLLKAIFAKDDIARKNSPSLKRVADVLRVGVEELRGRKAPEVEL